MKNTLFTKIIVAVFLPALLLLQAFAASYVVGLSPNYENTDKGKVLEQVLLLALQSAVPGDDITVCDALNQHVVARFAIPTGGMFQNNAQARARRLGTSIVAIKNFVMADHPHAPELTAAIDLPGFLDLAGSQLRKPGQSLRVVLVGSPFYVGDNGAFDQHDAYPSDANLTTDEGSSPFSTVSRNKSLIGVTVHYAYLRDGFVNDYHKDRLCRFNVLFMKAQSGCLATFAPDASLAFQRAVENIQQPVQAAEIDPNDTKLEMRHVRPRSIPIWFAPTNPPTATAVSNAVPVASTLEMPPTVVANDIQVTLVTNLVTNTVAVAPPVNFPVPAKDNIVGIGLMWSAPVDIDLHVLPNKSAKELYFGRSTTKEGKYFQDYRNANDGLDYEFVELKAPVDIREVSAWANYYGGRAGPVKGKVIVYYEGKTYCGEFALSARSGNRCNETSTRGSSQYWTKIDLTRIVGLSN
jgi:hypothetical protein